MIIGTFDLEDFTKGLVVQRVKTSYLSRRIYLRLRAMEDRLDNLSIEVYGEEK